MDGLTEREDNVDQRLAVLAFDRACICQIEAVQNGVSIWSEKWWVSVQLSERPASLVYLFIPSGCGFVCTALPRTRSSCRGARCDRSTRRPCSDYRHASPAAEFDACGVKITLCRSYALITIWNRGLDPSSSTGASELVDHEKPGLGHQRELPVKSVLDRRAQRCFVSKFLKQFLYYFSAA